MSSVNETSVQEATGVDGSLNEKGIDSKRKMHVLYSRGRMFKSDYDVNYFDSLQKIAVLTRRSPQEVEEIILTGERKKIKSSSTLKTLVQLEAQLKELSLDVYIEPTPESLKS